MTEGVECYGCRDLRSENTFKAWAIGLLVVALLAGIGGCLAGNVQANNAKMELVQARTQIAELEARATANLGAATPAPNGAYRVEACSLHLKACIMTSLGAMRGLEKSRFYSLDYVPVGANERLVAVEGGQATWADPFK